MSCHCCTSRSREQSSVQTSDHPPVKSCQSHTARTNLYSSSWEGKEFPSPVCRRAHPSFRTVPHRSQSWASCRHCSSAQDCTQQERQRSRRAPVRAPFHDSIRASESCGPQISPLGVHGLARRRARSASPSVLHAWSRKRCPLPCRLRLTDIPHVPIPPQAVPPSCAAFRAKVPG